MTMSNHSNVPGPYEVEVFDAHDKNVYKGRAQRVTVGVNDYLDLHGVAMKIQPGEWTRLTVMKAKRASP